ncbi:YtxH domain-containing protein [Evansella cellulosilytica]|uniref:Gas vesicle protein n=1 Tax=Evansella cellulosilytica (strain ATCC 21833 / DSM 2522 / FERM P-1141 / JCM 9156 / N-4) TaxID=649639 RepID=E6TWY6_EVAC2|nr:YtxH domain-containing protein [Evansella cellulosilytica]ADU29936.1 hypothetical protein Bcell_1673 [Evansella cellulosilytica DSM 2522]
MSKIDTKDFLIGAVVGGIIGAATAMLYAPKSGKELRSDINEKAVSAKNKTIELKNTAVEKGSEYGQLAKDQWERLSDKTQQFKEKATSTGEEVSEDVKSVIKSGVEDGKELAQEVVNEIEEAKEKIKEDVNTLK